MYLSYWKLGESPFARRLDVHQFFPSSTHQEALARLEFLVAHQRPVGLLSGPDGTGKSLLLYKLAHQLSRRGYRVAVAALVGASVDDVLWSLAGQLGCGDRADIPSVRLWSRLVDRVEENRRLHRSTVFLLDDVDEASADVQSLLIRLAHADLSSDARHSLILTCDTARIDRVTPRLLDLVDLRVSLEPWEESETGDYLKAALLNAGCSQSVFDEAAIAGIHALSGGVPRQVNRLADLALVAAAGQQADYVDGETITAVAGELAACT